MKLKDLCEQKNIPYNVKNPTRSLNAIKNEAIQLLKDKGLLYET